MPIDPVKIPQNVYIEDRIVGPLTLKQTIILAAGGGFSYALFAMIQKTYGSVSIPVTIVVWLPCVVAAAFALIKINDLSLIRICFLMLERFHKPATRTFSPRKGITINIRTAPSKAELLETVQEQEKKAAESGKTEKRIRELSTILDSSVPANARRPIADGESPESVEPPENDPLDPWNNTETDEKPRRTVDPRRISVDGNDEGPGDLSLFRDVFPES
ncbi:MAG: PrgI family protein [Patescibacteria group bacterium]